MTTDQRQALIDAAFELVLRARTCESPIVARFLLQMVDVLHAQWAAE